MVSLLHRPDQDTGSAGNTSTRSATAVRRFRLKSSSIKVPPSPCVGLPTLLRGLARNLDLVALVSAMAEEMTTSRASLASAAGQPLRPACHPLAPRGAG